jgi:hypothetical protein
MEADMAAAAAEVMGQAAGDGHMRLGIVGALGELPIWLYLELSFKGTHL